ncbi:MAG: 3',5'-cyclic-AMP phosphodiesterase [Halieaceae bacterium]|jgi:Icc protein|nr:3',5'-cyclic-AMP phosphodiesterase [Halieaceae bacterium]
MNDALMQIAAAGNPLRLVQITDTHLKQEAGGSLVGMNTDNSLAHVIDLVKREQPAIDLVLGTGDISDHGSEEAYQRAAVFFSRLEAPVLWLPGNHDDASAMNRVLGQQGKLLRAAVGGNWIVVLLNSQIPGEVGGELGATELAWLEECLQYAERNQLHCLVCLHHQPVPMGSAWIDTQMVADRESFFATLARYSCVRGVLWGHVHQQLDAERDGVRLMSTPSSCIQFAPNNDDFKIDDIAPGYRWLELYADGRIITGVSRVEGVRFEVDLQSSGYL